MTDDTRLTDITRKLENSAKYGIDVTLRPEEQKLLLKLLHGKQPTEANIYELVDRDLCPVIYMDIAACYPKKDVRDRIDSLIKEEADTDKIRFALKEQFHAREISPEHIVLPHIE